MGIFRAKHSHWREMKMAPLLWGPQPRPYLVTRALKWNKSAIKKQALPIETLLMRQPERVVPARCDNGAPRSPFNCIFSQVFFVPSDRQVGPGVLDPSQATAGREPENKTMHFYITVLFFFFFSVLLHKQESSLIATVTSLRHRCRWVVGGRAPSMLHRFLSHYLGLVMDHGSNWTSFGWCITGVQHPHAPTPTP